MKTNLLKPLVERMLTEVGKPQAKVQLLTNPKLDGYEDAVKAIKNELQGRYSFYDLWLFLPDADRAKGLDALESELTTKGIRLLCCPAAPEVEAWLLAGHRSKLSISWSNIPSHHRLKEEVFEPFLREHGDSFAIGGGREKLMRETLQNYRGLLEVCPELASLEQRLRQLLAT
jgi:hypothetical protein